MPHLLFNGERQNFPDVDTVAHLVEALGFTGKRIAVELNGEIVPRSLYTATLLAENDTLEIIIAVGGG